MIWFQGDYVKELIDATDYPTFDIEGVNKTFMEWEHHKMENIMAFRNNSYRSLMTGTMSPKHHTPWKEAMDNSLEAYLEREVSRFTQTGKGDRLANMSTFLLEDPHEQAP